MQRQKNRPRRPANKATIRALQLAGWRYSSTRDAWVHRAFRGRVGPVFVDPAALDHPGLIGPMEFIAAQPFRAEEVIIDDGPRPPLPRRPRLRTDLTRVEVRLSEAEEPRVVAVDGKPPRCGREHLVPPRADNVVPLRSVAG
jgi:hypothetical protein